MPSKPAATEPTPGDVFTDFPDGPSMVVIPAGRCEIGAIEEDRFDNITERPRALYELPRSIAVARCLTTFDEWDRYAADADHALPPDYDKGRGRHPVTSVSWLQVQDYLAWLSERAGKTYRLLTEREWEYCCRAGTSTVFNTGDAIELNQANYLLSENGEKIGLGHPTDVDAYPPNAFGLHDMHGNALEFTADAWSLSLDDKPASHSSNDGVCVRGGAWDYPPRLLRCSYRDAVPRHVGYDNVGFRVARNL